MARDARWVIKSTFEQMRTEQEERWLMKRRCSNG